MVTEYRIQRKSDGLFSTGGSVQYKNLKFNRWGKVWRNRSGLSNHLVMIEKEKKCSHKPTAEAAQSVYSDCEIICYEGVGCPGKVVSSVADYVRDLNARR